MRIDDLWSSRWSQRWVIPFLIFVVAFVPRAIYPVSRSDLWYTRAIEFTDAVLAGDWARTYLSYHPGVVTMWVAGFGLKLFAWSGGLSSAQLLGDEPTKPGTIADGYAAGVLPLALVIALCIAAFYPLLSRIVGRKVAFVATFLLALDPFHVMHSKVLHLDGLLSSFMFMSVLLLFSYVQRGKWRDLALAGVFAGLALLCKSPSVFLVPYAALVVGIDALARLGRAEGASITWRAWVGQACDAVRVLAVWGVAAAVVFALLWPAVWDDPQNALGSIYRMVNRHVKMLHFNPLYFNGEITFEDPGLPYYLATIAWKTTVVTLPLACATVVLALVQRRRGETGRLVWLLVAYVVFFAIQMGLAARKELRYILPVFPVLDLLAALGLVWIVEWVARTRLGQRWRWLPTAAIAAALVLQGGVSLSRHPYYGTHFNALLGGAGVARRILPLQDQCEGLDLAAEYLNTLPRSQRARAVVQANCANFFDRVFIGYTSIVEEPWTDYRVYFVNHVMRCLQVEEWGEAWETDRQDEPLWTKDFDGVTYVWVYGDAPGELAVGGPERAVNYRLGEHIVLKRVRLTSDVLHPGDALVVVLIWESDGEVQGNYVVFSHLLSPGGELAAQHDGPPIQGVRPTPSWRAGEVIEDGHLVQLGDDVNPGKYELAVGMYDAETMQRVPVYDASGGRLPDDRIVVGTVRVEASGATLQ